MSRKSVSSFHNEDVNPCIQESKLSQECLELSLYDYAKCEVVFENYRQCKKFWGSIKKKRSRAGVTPSMPTKEERHKIMLLKEKGIHVISAQD